MTKDEQTKKPPKMGRGGGPIRLIEKPKDFKKSLKQITKFMKPHWLKILLALVFAAVGTVFAVFGPKVASKVTEEIIIGTMGLGIDFARIATISLWVLALHVASGILQFTQNFIMSGITAKVSRDLRNKISEKINKLPLKYFDSNMYGDILSRVTNDVDTVGQTLNQTLSSLISNITRVIGMLVMMFTISVPLTFIVLATIPISSVLVILTVKKSQKYFKTQQQVLGNINGHIEEIYTNHDVMKVFNGEKEAEKTFDGYNEKLYTSGYKSQFISGLMMPIMQFVGNLGYVAVCIVGGIMALNNPVFIASIIALIQYARQINQPISQFASIVGTLQSTMAASERVFNFLDEKEQENEDNKNVVIKDFKGKVEFKNVNFGYNKDKQIINDFSCTVKPGQKIAIVGPTGAGKTTIVNLLMRFYDIDSGEILIDGVSTKDMKREDVRALFGMVLQDTWLFEGTIDENLRYGKPNATKEEIENAAKMADADHFIKTLPKSYNLMLDDDADLSQGQKQLLTIARAMVQNAPMLILDEATSSVDTRTEILIQKAMDKLMKGRTTFVIAHRLSTIKNADMILVMKDGSIIEKGKHSALMSQDGFYKELYNSQFTNQES